MSYFVRVEDAVIESALEFGKISPKSLQKFICKGGEVAGWSIRNLGSVRISQVFDCSDGDPVILGSVSVLPGIDLTGGYFSSGCIPDGDPEEEKTKFYKVDYL